MLHFEASRLLEYYMHRDPKTARKFSRILADIEAGTVNEPAAWAMVRKYSTPDYLRYSAPPVEMLQVSMSSAFMNKEERVMPSDSALGAPDMSEWRPAFSKSFRKMTVSPRKFAQTVTAGYAWAVGVYRDNHRTKGNFISSQILALDFDDKVDVPDVLNKPFARRYAGLVYPSPSSIPSYPKSRAVFFLDAPVTGAQLWERLQEAVIEHFADMSPDPKCKDCARFYYGSNVPTAGFMPKNVLPIDAVFALPEWSELRRREEEAQRQRESVRFTGAVNEKAIKGYTETVVRNASLAGSGDRNNALYKASIALFSKSREEGWNTSDAVLEQLLLQAAISNGLIKDDGHHSAVATINSAKRRAS